MNPNLIYVGLTKEQYNLFKEILQHYKKILTEEITTRNETVRVLEEQRETIIDIQEQLKDEAPSSN